MKPISIALALSLFTLSSCVVHVHVHPAEAPGAVMAEASPLREAPLDTPADTPADTQEVAGQMRPGLPGQALSGRVLDAEGRPVRTHVSLVSSSGSLGMMSAKDGSFSFKPFSSGAHVLSSNTDSSYGFQEVEPGEPTQVFLKHPVGTLKFTMSGQSSMRLAIFKNGTRIEDSTVRDGKPSRFVLPAGALQLRLYQGDDLVQSELELEPGETRSMAIRVASKTR